MGDRLVIGDRQSFRAMAGHLVTGVSIVVVMVDGEPFATTAGSVVAASWAPPLLAVFFREGSRMAASLDAAGQFTVNVLGEADHGLAHRFGRSFRSHGWETLADIPLLRRDPDPPVLSSAAAWAACAITQTIPIGDHCCYVGDVLDHQRNGARAPLAYYRGRFRGLGQPVTPAAWTAIDIGVMQDAW